MYIILKIYLHLHFVHCYRTSKCLKKINIFYCKMLKCYALFLWAFCLSVFFNVNFEIMILQINNSVELLCNIFNVQTFIFNQEKMHNLFQSSGVIFRFVKKFQYLYYPVYLYTLEIILGILCNFQ